jgi:hypothetical protein
MRSGGGAEPRDAADPRRAAEPRVERGVWGSITSPPSTSITPPEPKRALLPQAAAPRTNQEPRTGVVRRLPVSAPAAPPQSGALERSRQRARQREQNRVASLQPGQSGIVRRDRRRDDAGEASAAHEDVRAWRCLEWGSAPKARVQKNPKVTIVQLSAGGEPVRQDGPDAWLPEAGDFIHRMAQLVARSFGHERCRSVCLRGPSAVLAVSEVNDAKVMAVSGPASSMANVLRRAGLE